MSFEPKEKHADKAVDEKVLTSTVDSDQLESLGLEDDGREPTDEENQKLRHVGERIPISCWLVAIVELAERFSYYGLSTPFQNYMQYGPHDTPKGMLSLSQTGATALSYFWQFWCYVTPIFGAWVADTYLGKFNTIALFCGVYFVGIFILFITSIESIATHHNAGLIGFILAIIIIGIGTGGVKSNVAPLIADQVPKNKPVIKVLKSGERVIQDPNITIQNVFMFFYLMINVGSMSVIATTELEAHKGFWAAYLLPLCFFSLTLIVLVVGKKHYVKVPVGDKVIAKTFKCSWLALKNGMNYDIAKPSLHPEANYPWNDKFVEEVRRALYACKVFVYYPVYWVVYGQMLNNFISSAADMALHGLPNDILLCIDSFTIILFIPICERIVYPFVRRFTPFRPITKIFWGFMFGAAAMVYAAVLQYYIYKPCRDHPGSCGTNYSDIPAHVHVAIQAPAYFLIGMSEILASITGLEYAYTKAPASMKSFIMSLFLVTNAFGSALGIALSSVSENPKMVWTYSGLGVACFLAGILFWFTFSHYNKKELEWNNLEFADNEEVEQHGHGLAPITSLQTSYKELR